MTVFQLIRTPLISDTPFVMTLFLTNGCLFEQRLSQGDCCSPRQCSRIVEHHVTWHNLEYGTSHIKVNILRAYNSYGHGQSTDTCTGIVDITYGCTTGKATGVLWKTCG